jgi:hypothetical protein
VIICIVSPGNLASNPRVLKEADALHEAGHAVTAVVCDYTEALRPFDDEIAGRVPWKVIRVARPVGERQVGQAARGLAKLAAGLGMRAPLAVAASAYGGPVAALRRAASEVPADLYIAHYIAGLAAAADVARRRRAMLGFDAEDYHAGEGTPFRMSMVRTIESALLPACRHVTAAAPLIGKAYAAQCRVEPTTVLNVFPLAMAPTQSHAAGAHDTFKAYWFSQTIGLDRGLQSFHPGDGAHQDARHPRHPRRQPVGTWRAAGRAGARTRHRRSGQSAADGIARGDGEAGRVL